MIVFTLNSTLCWQITLTLFHVSWLGVLIGLMAAIASRAFSQKSAAGRYWIYMTALMTLAASLPITFVVIRVLAEDKSPQAASPLVQTSNFNTPVIDSSPSSYPPESSARATALASEPDAVVTDAQASATRFSSNIAVSQQLRELAKSAAPFVTVAYVIGVLLMLIKLSIGVRVTRRLRSFSVPISDVDLLARMAEQARKLSLRFQPVIAICDHVAVPIVLGLLRPMILIPAAMFSGLTSEQLEAVLTHELAHLRRADHILIVVQRVFEAILFFHPVTWYLSRHIHHERECCCDDLVVSIGRDRVQYAQSLLRVAELNQSTISGRRHLGLAADGQRPSKLRLRIMRLLDAREDDAVRINPRWLFATLTCLGIAVFWTSTIASQPLSKADDEAQSGSATSKTSDVAVMLEGQIHRIGLVVMQELSREELDYLSNTPR